MSIKVMTAVFEASGLNPAEKVVALAYADHAHDDGTEARIGIERVRTKTALSRRTVQKTIASLLEKGVIAVQRPATNLLPVCYRFLLSPDQRYLQFGGADSAGLDGVSGGANDVSWGSSHDTQTISNESSEPSDISAPSGAEKTKHEYSPEFEEIWKLYPKRKGKLSAFKAFKTRLKQGVEYDDLVNAVKNYAALKAGTDEQYLLNGETFFGSNERWADYLDGPVASIPFELSPEQKEIAEIYEQYDAGEEWFDPKSLEFTLDNPYLRDYSRPKNSNGQLVDINGRPYTVTVQGTRQAIGEQ